jgi:hypothetical protein
MMKAWLGLTASALLVACAASAPVPPQRDARADGAFTDAERRKQSLDQAFAAASADQRRRCELLSGDCRMDVRDGRDELLRAHSPGRCRSASDSDAELACTLADLRQNGEADVASRYLRLENWCLQQLVTCTAKLRDEAAAQAKQDRIRDRRVRIEQSLEGIESEALVSTARETTGYLRSVLPPRADGVCTDGFDRSECEAAAQSLVAELEPELDKEEGEYSPEAALQIYVSSHKAEARCYDPEIDCLTKQLDTYGGTAETRRLLADSLKELGRRERLVLEIGAERAERCLAAQLKQRQPEIVEHYQRFAREPVLFFQAELHRDFRTLYENQSGCLAHIAHPKPVSLAASTSGPAPAISRTIAPKQP